MAGGGQRPGIFFRVEAAAIRQLIFFSLIFLYAGGCARIVPGPTPLVGDERALVLSRYEKYLQRSSLCTGIEADVSLQYKSIFKDARIPGMLLAKSPASLKIMGLGPLDQPLLLFSLHDARFTLIDVQRQKAFAGSIRANKVAELLPLEQLVGVGLYALLIGRPAIPVEASVVVRRLSKGEQGRYLLTWPGKGRHMQVVFNVASGQPEAFRLLDAPDRVSLEILYSQQREQRCGVPATVRISGSKVRGTVECSFEKIFPADSLAAKEFKLSVPDGFKVEEIR